MLRATTCTFSTSQRPKVVREWCVLYNLTWKCASRHNGVQFFISHLASWLRTRRFSEPTPVPQIIGKTLWIATFLPFRASTLLSSNLSLLYASALLCFSSVHIVGSMTSKLPSVNFRIITSLYLPNIQFVVYYWVPRTLLSLGIQGRNHHKCMVYELSGDPLKTYHYWQKTYYYLQKANYYREPSVKP